MDSPTRVGLGCTAQAAGSPAAAGVLLLVAETPEGQRSGFQVAQDGEHPPVAAIRRQKAELAEDVADVLFDGSV